MVGLWLGGSAILFAAVTWMAWAGRLGIPAIALIFGAFFLFWMGRRGLEGTARERADLVAKIVFTVAGMLALLRHPIDVEGVPTPLHEAIAVHVGTVDGTTFVTWALVAMAVKFVGVIASAWAWHLLLVGQGIRFPFWQTTMTSFLIGRFIGTFLPSTLGLDGYTLFESARYSGQPARAVTAKALEKFIGVTGLFLGMVLTMPFGYSVIVDVVSSDAVGRPDAAPLLASGIVAVAGGVSAVVVLGLVKPGLIVALMRGITRLTESVKGPFGQVGAKGVGALERFTDAVGAYHGKVGLLLTALVAKFVTHFTTFVVYYFTGLAIGVTAIEFWPVVFGSSIQVLATVLSPTIAGEGAREAFQALLLQNQYGGVAQAVLAGALGFIAAEAATLWGGAFLWVRTPSWRPSFCTVDGEQVDYAWITGDEAGFDADALARIRQEADGS